MNLKAKKSSAKPAAVKNSNQTVTAGPIGDFDAGDTSSRASQVYDAIREALRDGTLKAGQRLRERQVGTWLNVSRTPVREAFKRLEMQGIVTNTGSEGLVITVLTREEIAELYAVWADLEGIAARYAAQHATDLNIAALTSICERWKGELDPKVLGQLNKQFHQIIYESGRNRYLRRALQSIDDSLALLGISTYRLPGRPAEAEREHLAVAQAIINRDPGAAEKAARAHIQRAGELRMKIAIEMD